MLPPFFSSSFLSYMVRCAFIRVEWNWLCVYLFFYFFFITVVGFLCKAFLQFNTAPFSGNQTKLVSFFRFFFSQSNFFFKFVLFIRSIRSIFFFFFDIHNTRSMWLEANWCVQLSIRNEICMKTNMHSRLWTLVRFPYAIFLSLFLSFFCYPWWGEWMCVSMFVELSFVSFFFCFSKTMGLRLTRCNRIGASPKKIFSVFLWFTLIFLNIPAAVVATDLFTIHSPPRPFVYVI